MKKISAFVRAHVGAAIAAATIAVVLVGGVLLIVTTGGGATASTAPSSSTTLAPAAAGKGGARTGQRRRGVRGAITSITGSSWTVTSARGPAVTVDVTPATVFGTKAAPLTASDFAVGDQIVVIGTRSGTSVQATRITKPTAATAP